MGDGAVILFCSSFVAIAHPAPAFSLGGEKASAKRDLEGGTPHKIDLLRK